MSGREMREGVRGSGFTAALLLAFAAGVYHRPFLPEILPSYASYASTAPWASWGWSAAMIALGLLFAPACSMQRIVVHAFNTAFWMLAAGHVAGEIGYTPGAGIMMIIGIMGAIMLGQAIALWQSRRPWWDRVVSDPPAWLRRLAGVDGTREDGDGHA